MVQVFAHRGFSGPHPEMTRAAFTAAIELSATRQQPLGLECDVHFTADGELGCLHDRTVQRTARTADGAEVDTELSALTVAELRALDFGAWRDDLTGQRDLTEAEREFCTLADLLDLVAQARGDGLEVGVAIEAKHPVPRDTEVESMIAAHLRERGWTGADGPIRMITFDPDGITRMAELLPELPLTFLLDRTSTWQAVEDGQIVIGTEVAIGVGGRLLREDPAIVARIKATGRECHVWTVNDPADIRAVLDLGVDAVTSDDPDRVFDALGV